MQERTLLDHISERSCSVKIEKYITDSGKEYVIGEPSRLAYENSTYGRERLKEDYPEYFSVLTATVWGDTPKVEDVPSEEIVEKNTKKGENK